MTSVAMIGVVLHPLFKGKIICSLCGKTYTVNTFGKYSQDCAVLSVQIKNDNHLVRCTTSDVIVADVDGVVYSGATQLADSGGTPQESVAQEYSKGWD